MHCKPHAEFYRLPLFPREAFGSSWVHHGHSWGPINRIATHEDPRGAHGEPMRIYMEAGGGRDCIHGVGMGAWRSCCRPYSRCTVYTRCTIATSSDLRRRAPPCCHSSLLQQIKNENQKTNYDLLVKKMFDSTQYLCSKTKTKIWIVSQKGLDSTSRL